MDVKCIQIKISRIMCGFGVITIVASKSGTNITAEFCADGYIPQEIGEVYSEISMGRFIELLTPYWNNSGDIDVEELDTAFEWTIEFYNDDMMISQLCSTNNENLQKLISDIINEGADENIFENLKELVN